jgi:spermidine synthase
MVRIARTYFPHISRGCWEDPRVSLVIEDVRTFLSRTDARFELILFDVSEPLDGTPAHGLFSRVMLGELGRHLAPDGRFVTWAGSAGPRSCELARGISSAVRSVFPYVDPMLCHTQSYGTSWITLIAGNAPLDPVSLSVAQVDAQIQMQIEGDLRLYDGVTHHHLFHLPRDVRALLAQPDPGHGDDNPRLVLSRNIPMQESEQVP